MLVMTNIYAENYASPLYTKAYPLETLAVK